MSGVQLEYRISQRWLADRREYYPKSGFQKKSKSGPI